jgi:hypothetical protein
LEQAKEEAACDAWFNEARPMKVPEKTWKEKRIEREGRSESEDTAPEGDHAHGELGINMVFELPAGFRVPEVVVAELVLGAKLASFEKPEKLGEHMKPLFITSHMEGRPVRRVMVDGGAGVNVMPISTFEKLGFSERELMKTNTRLSAFTGEVTEAKGVMSVELMVGSKTTPTTFFIVDVKGKYNLLLGRDWIHANGCVPSTLHQCLIQWIGDDVEVVAAEDLVCVATAEPEDNSPDGSTACLSGRDLSGYDYVSMSHDGLVPISVKPTDMTQLGNLSL